MHRRINIVILESAALALWLGAAVFFAVSVAPALFAVLPTRALAGAVVGKILPALLFAGLTVGALVVAFELMASGRAWSRARFACGGIVAVSCGIAQFAVGARIERLRASIAGPLDSLAIDDPRRVEFGRLHGFSVAWLGVAMLAAIAALVITARSLQPRS